MFCAVSFTCFVPLGLRFFCRYLYMFCAVNFTFWVVVETVRCNQKFVKLARCAFTRWGFVSKFTPTDMLQSVPNFQVVKHQVFILAIWRTGYD